MPVGRAGRPAPRVAPVSEHPVADTATRIRALQQQHEIDAEVRATRLALVQAIRRRGGLRSVAFLDEDFVAVADQAAMHLAIVDAAITVGGALRADLQLYDQRAGVLRMASQRGFLSRFLSYFAAVDVTQRTACSEVLIHREPVLIDDISRCAIFRDQPTLEVMVDAGSHAVYSYPLHSVGGGLLGVLSFHHRRPIAQDGRAQLVAFCAAQALDARSRQQPRAPEAALPAD
jgi:GAF domain-containing protein